MLVKNLVVGLSSVALLLCAVPVSAEGMTRDYLVPESIEVNVPVSESAQAEAENQVQPRAGVFNLTRGCMFQGGGGRLSGEVTLQCRDELANTSGSYILGVTKVKIFNANYQGFLKVDYNSARVKSVRYIDNHQAAVVTITVNVSYGSGYQTVTFSGSQVYA